MNFGKIPNTGEKKENNLEEMKLQDALREANIIKSIDNKFSDQENKEEFLIITKKIVEQIKNLPQEIKEDSWQSLLQLAKSEKTNDIFFYKELHDEILDAKKRNKEDIELSNQELPLDERISKCSSFEDLELVLNSTDGVKGGQREYDTKDLKGLIEDVRKFQAPLSVITRSVGLRDKLRELLSEPDSSVVVSNIKMQTLNSLENWQIQYTPDPEMIRLNRGSGWDLINKGEYKQTLRKIKEENIGADTNLWNLYKKEIFISDDINKDELGKKMNVTQELFQNKFILDAESLREAKENLEIIYEQTHVSIYKNLLDYINSDEDNFIGNQKSPLFQKLVNLKKGDNN
jgi:hypothetical protein